MRCTVPFPTPTIFATLMMPVRLAGTEDALSIPAEIDAITRKSERQRKTNFHADAAYERRNPNPALRYLNAGSKRGESRLPGESRWLNS